jgi:hypothetical protein
MTALNVLHVAVNAHKSTPRTFAKILSTNSFGVARKLGGSLLFGTVATASPYARYIGSNMHSEKSSCNSPSDFGK